MTDVAQHAGCSQSTVSVVLNDYLREFRTKLAAQRTHLQQVTNSAAAAQRCTRGLRGPKTRASREAPAHEECSNCR